jgi:hypothetical protein
MAPITQIGSVQQASLCGWVEVGTGCYEFEFGCVENSGYAFGLFLNYESICCKVASGGNINYPVALEPNYAGKWHFFCLTFDGTQAVAANRVTLYVDGVVQTLFQCGAGNPTSLDTSANLGLFQLNFGGLYFGGVAQDIRLYNVTLTQAQVTAIYGPGAQ